VASQCNIAVIPQTVQSDWSVVSPDSQQYITSHH